MGDCMTFPDTLDEFLEQYQFKDSEEIYTNGSMLIPVFRVKQWAEHAASTRENVAGKWEPAMRFCPICGEDKFKGLDADIWADWTPPFCPNCGASMESCY